MLLERMGIAVYLSLQCQCISLHTFMYNSNRVPMYLLVLGPQVKSSKTIPRHFYVHFKTLFHVYIPWSTQQLKSHHVTLSILSCPISASFTGKKKIPLVFVVVVILNKPVFLEHHLHVWPELRFCFRALCDIPPFFSASLI